MKFFDKAINRQNHSWTAAVLAFLFGAGIVMGAARCSAAQRPLTFQHVREVARYLDGVALAEPIAVGHLAVYPVLADDSTLLHGKWMTLGTARSTNTLLIREKRTPDKLVPWIENTSLDEHVFLMKGETIIWGNRTWKVLGDTVLAPGEKIRMDMLCAELPSNAGEKETPRQPISGNSEPTNQAERHLDRAHGDSLFGVNKSAAAAESTLQSTAIDNNPEELSREIVPRIPSGTTGFIFEKDGRAVAADFFGSESMALKLLPQLLQSQAMNNVIAHSGMGGRVQEINDRGAIAFFQRLCAAGSQTTTTPGSGLGLLTHDGELVGQGVVYDGNVVHYGVRIQPLGTPFRRPSPTIIWPQSEVYRQRQ